MRPLNRAAFSLLEVLWGLALGVVLATLVLRLLAISMRHLRDQRAAADTQATVRGAVDYLSAELGNTGWGAGESDIIELEPGRIRFRARRGLALACGSDPVGAVFLRAAGGYGRVPEPGRDSLAIFLEGDSMVTSDDAWLRLPVLSDAMDSLCPDGDSALAIVTPPDPRLSAGAVVRPDAPVVTWEVVEIRAYPSLGEIWLGEQSLTGGGVVEPAFGPLSPPGMVIEPMAVGGAPISSLPGIGALLVDVRAIARSHGGIRVADGVPWMDSLASWVSLRNASTMWGGR